MLIIESVQEISESSLIKFTCIENNSFDLLFWWIDQLLYTDRLIYTENKHPLDLFSFIPWDFPWPHLYFKKPQNCWTANDLFCISLSYFMFWYASYYFIQKHHVLFLNCENLSISVLLMIILFESLIGIVSYSCELRILWLVSS